MCLDKILYLCYVYFHFDTMAVGDTSVPINHAVQVFSYHESIVRDLKLDMCSRFFLQTMSTKA